MGVFDAAVAAQTKEANKLLNTLIAEQQRTNELLSRLIQAVEAAGGLPPYRGQPPRT